MCELSFSDFSPREEACRYATRQHAESNFFQSLGFGILVWEFDHIHLFVALVYLNGDAGRGRGSRCDSLVGEVMSDRLHGRRHRDSPVQASGIRRRDFVLLGIEGIAQRELNVPFRAGKGKALGIIG